MTVADVWQEHNCGMTHHVINSVLIRGARKIGETMRVRSARRIAGRSEKCAALPQDVT
jgi:hypothetical protein